MTFDDLDFEFLPSPVSGFEMVGSAAAGSGLRATHHFDNGYGISVTRTVGTYGWQQGLFEIAVLKKRENQWEICHDSPITDDVIGYCSPQKINVILRIIESLG